MTRSMPTTSAIPSATASAEKNSPPNACSDAVSVTSRPGDARGALRGQDHQAASAICSPIDMSCPAACDDEQRAEREVDAGAVEVERVARRQHHPTVCCEAPADSSLASRRGSTVSDDDVPTMISSSSLISRIELEDVEAAPARDQSEDPDDEHRARPPERDHQQREVRDAAAELGDGVGHAAERAERRGPHDHADDPEDDLRDDLEDRDDPLALRRASPEMAAATRMARISTRRISFSTNGSHEAVGQQVVGDEAGGAAAAARRPRRSSPSPPPARWR